MALYKVKNGQNIYDVALHLYGSIEGVFDLMISNPNLSLNDKLSNGVELQYHEDFVINSSIVEQFHKDNIIPINGERTVYYKHTDEPLRAILNIDPEVDYVKFLISGEGRMIIDWGDNSALETINLSHNERTLEHYFDNNVDVTRKIMWFSDFTVMSLNMSKFKTDFYLTAPMIVDEFTSQSNDKPLDSLFLFKGTHSINLQKSVIADLSPIYSMNLSTLDLRGVQYKNIEILDKYLVNLVENHQNRRACTVFLDTAPSEKGMAAINTIINEPEWNSPTKWAFHINETIYTAQ